MGVSLLKGLVGGGSVLLWESDGHGMSWPGSGMAGVL